MPVLYCLCKFTNTGTEARGFCRFEEYVPVKKRREMAEKQRLAKVGKVGKIVTQLRLRIPLVH